MFTTAAVNGEQIVIERNTEQLQVVPTIDTPINGKNTIYCITFQMAWDELIDIVKGQVTTEPMVSIVEKLNNNIYTNRSKTFVSQDCFLSDVATSSGYISIKTELEKSLSFEGPFEKLGGGKFGEEGMLNTLE